MGTGTTPYFHNQLLEAFIYVQRLSCALALRLSALQLISRAGSAAQGRDSPPTVPSIYEPRTRERPALAQHAGLLSAAPCRAWFLAGFGCNAIFMFASMRCRHMNDSEQSSSASSSIGNHLQNPTVS